MLAGRGIDSCDKVAYQQHVDGAIAHASCFDGGKWMVELGRVIPSPTSVPPYADV